MRQALLLVPTLGALAAAGCAPDTEPLEGNANLEALAAKVATLEASSTAQAGKVAALEGKVAFLDQCGAGDVLVRDAAGWRCTKDPPCPAGFVESRPTTEITVCTRTFRGASDVMVRVGDFWIDRYELSACPGAPTSLGMESATGTTAAACSTSGVMPQVNVTWFQAAAMCANAGKHLCTDAQWQVAASGTDDLGAWPVTTGACSAAGPAPGQCNTCSSGKRPAGQGTQCGSRFGAEDMIGNVWEWTADWYVAGIPWSPVMARGQNATPWPPGRGYGDGADITANIGGEADNGVGWKSGAPAAGLRGGNWGLGTGAGAFALNLSNGPSLVDASVGARCCAGVR